MSLTHHRLSLTPKRMIIRRCARPRRYHPLCDMSKAEDDSFIHFLEESMEKALNGVKYVYIQRLELRQELKTLRAENDKLREKLLEIDQPRWQYARNVEAKKIDHIGHKMILEGDKYQEFIDPDLLNNGDGSIDQEY